MGAEESLSNATGEAAGRKVPVWGIAIGVAQTAKKGWDAKKAFARAANGSRSKQDRIAATRAETIYCRRAILKATSTVAGQIPVYGTAAALALDAVNGALNLADGNPKELEKEASRSGIRKRRSTEAFMRLMREQAENADRGSRNAERRAENADRGSRNNKAFISPDPELHALNEERSRNENQMICPFHDRARWQVASM